jgi:hypothetical protein
MGLFSLVLEIYHTKPMHKPPTQHNLQRSFDAKISTSFDTSVTPDVLQQLLADKRSPNTRRAYEKDVTQFLGS